MRMGGGGHADDNLDEGVHSRLGTNLMFEWKGNYERGG